jgi:hypothetical protein
METRRSLGVRHVIRVAAVALADEKMMPDDRARALLARIRSEQVLRRLDGAGVAGVEHVVERPERLPQRLPGDGRLAAALLGEGNQVIRDPLHGAAGLVVQIEVIPLLDDIALRLAVPDEDEQGGACHDPSTSQRKDRIGLAISSAR